MSANIISAAQVNIDRTSDEAVAIDQSKNTVVFSAEKITAVISELHMCYDYCAAWKEPPPDEIPVSTEGNS